MFCERKWYYEEKTVILTKNIFFGIIDILYCKGDIKTFKNVCLCNGSKYIIKINPNYIFMLEKTENNIIGAIKQGNLFNVFNPEIQIYVDEWVWKLRKYINKKYFS